MEFKYLFLILLFCTLEISQSKSNLRLTNHLKSHLKLKRQEPYYFIDPRIQVQAFASQPLQMAPDVDFKNIIDKKLNQLEGNPKGSPEGIFAYPVIYPKFFPHEMVPKGKPEETEQQLPSIMFNIANNFQR